MDNHIFTPGILRVLHLDRATGSNERLTGWWNRTDLLKSGGNNFVPVGLLVIGGTIDYSGFAFTETLYDTGLDVWPQPKNWKVRPPPGRSHWLSLFWMSTEAGHPAAAAHWEGISVRVGRMGKRDDGIRNGFVGKPIVQKEGGGQAGVDVNGNL